jgi:hypothetical protein
VLLSRPAQYCQWWRLSPCLRPPDAFSRANADCSRRNFHASHFASLVHVETNVLISVFVCLFSAVSSHATQYYVNTSGSDSNNGTSVSSPWQTITKINSFHYLPGDIISFNAGQQFQGTITLAESGTSSNAIIITSYGSGRATISSGIGDGIDLRNSQYITVTDINITGSGVNNGGIQNIGLNVSRDDSGTTLLSSINVHNVTVSGFRSAGFSIGSTSGAGYRNCSFTNDIAHDNGQAGLWTYAASTHNTNFLVSNCVFYNNIGIGGNTGYGMFYKQTDNSTVKLCEVYNNGANSTGANGPVGIMILYGANDVVESNEIYHQHTGSSADGDGIDLDLGSTNSIVQFNYTHENDGPGILLSGGPTNNTIRYNISQNDCRTNGHGSIFIYGFGDGNNIFNNTVYLGSFGAQNSSYVAAFSHFAGSGANGVIRLSNNIFETNNGVPLINVPNGQTVGLFFNGNDYWNDGGTGAFVMYWGGAAYSSLSSWRQTGQETGTGYNVTASLNSPGNGGTIGNGGLLKTLSAYQQKSDSFMNDHGLDLKALYGIDMGTQNFYGDSIVQQINIGAGDDSPRVFLFENSNGDVVVYFNGLLEESADLSTWTNASGSPSSALIIPKSNAPPKQFFRAQQN